MGKGYNPTSAVSSDLDELCINTVRFLSVDAVQKANSGHPGMPMGAAPMAYVLWTLFLKHNPSNPRWFDRDRFILSAGHGSMLLYSLLHLTGYDLPLEEIKRFRQWGSITPGHPESILTPGVEVTTGPLGQGFGNGVGMAIAEAHLAARFNRPGFNVIDHFTYGIVSDGDLMEGVASEAASLAGHLRLGKLIYFYDNNHISLSSATSLTFTEDRAKRFEAYGWHTRIIEDGNDTDSITNAVLEAEGEVERPSLILVRTHIGYGAPHKQDTFEVHGAPLGEEEVRLAKGNLGWPVEPLFFIPDQALEHFRKAVTEGRKLEAGWQNLFSSYEREFPELAADLRQIMRGELPKGWDANIPSFPPDPKGVATRAASGRVINAIAPRLPFLAGGSADLDPSTHTVLKGMGDYENPKSEAGDTQGSVGGGWSYAGRNIHFGVRPARWRRSCWRAGSRRTSSTRRWPRARGRASSSSSRGRRRRTGRPGIHHVFSRTLKDLFCRHRAMRGFHVSRKAGWDTHGLPVEIEVEKALGISGKQDIERLGVEEFNRRCRESVWKYREEWEKLSARMGYWLDYANPYVTYSNGYVESVWWALKTLYDRKLLYAGHKILPAIRCVYVFQAKFPARSNSFRSHLNKPMQKQTRW